MFEKLSKVEKKIAKFIAKERFTEFKVGSTKVHLEYKNSPEVAMKYFIPGVALTRRPKVCFAIVAFIWNKRFLLRFIFDSNKAAPRFTFNSDKRKC